MLDCNSAISLNSFSDDAYGVRGYLWYKRKDYFKAVDDYNRALKIKPENIKVLMSRAIALYDMKKVKEIQVVYGGHYTMNFNIGKYISGNHQRKRSP